MPLNPEQTAIVNRFDVATSAIAAEIKRLVENPPSAAEFNTRLLTIADGLDTLGKPGTPIPGPGPQPTP